ncbi:MAG: hypothetical protein ACO3HP_05410 [Candidatus Nanopelagicaceae bacterium]
MAQSRLITDLVELVTPNNDDVLVIVDNTTDPTLSVTKKIKYSSLKESLQDIIDLFVQEGTGISTTYDDAANSLTISVVNDTTTQRSIITNDGNLVGIRPQLNVIPGAGVTISGVDNVGSNRVDLTLNTTNVSTASGLVGSGSTFSPLSGITTLGDGTKRLDIRALKVENNKLSIGLTDNNQSIVLGIQPGNIELNEFSFSTPLAIARGGTGGSTAETARASLGAAVLGSNNDITELTGLTTALSISQGGTDGTTAQESLFNLEGLSYVANVGGIGQSLVVNGKNAVAGEYRAELKSIRNGSSKVSVSTISNAVTIDVNANDVLNAASQNINFNSFRLTNVAEPIADNDVATKAYADAVAQGLTVKEASRVATTANFYGTYFNSVGTVSAVDIGTDELTINNHPFATGDRVYITSTTNIPGGLNLGTTYFIINTGVNTIKLAANAVDAAAGTAIDITTTGSGTITVEHTLYLVAGQNGAYSVDGISLDVGDRVLVKDQITASLNGIYVVSVVGDVSTPAVITRADDANASNELGAGTFTFIIEGTANGGIAYVQVEAAPTLDVDPLTWTVFSASSIPANTVTNAKLVQVSEATVKGRAVAAGTGDVQDLTANQLVAIVNTATDAIDCGTY